MIKFIQSLNWEAIIACASLLLSLFILIKDHVQSKENYRIDVIDHAMRTSTIMQLLVVITNYSDNPLTIVSVKCGESICELEPKMIHGTPGKTNFAVSPRFPVCIPAHGCKYVYLEFQDYGHTRPTPGTSLTLEIRSTRLLARKTVPLGDISHYLHTREQLREYRDSQQSI